MSVAAPTISREKRKDDDNKKKLIRVISTKLSIEDDNYLQQVTTVAYRNGDIKEPTKSEFVRFLITLLLSGVRRSRRNYLWSIVRRSKVAAKSTLILR